MLFSLEPKCHTECDSGQCCHWNEELESMVTQRLCIVDIELAISLYIICLYHPNWAKQLINEVAEVVCPWLLALLSFVMFPFFFTSDNALSSRQWKSLSLIHVLSTLWLARGLELSHLNKPFESSTTGVLRPPLQTTQYPNSGVDQSTVVKFTLTQVNYTHDQNTFRLT